MTYLGYIFKKMINNNYLKYISDKLDSLNRVDRSSNKSTGEWGLPEKDLINMVGDSSKRWLEQKGKLK